ncbi:MAG: pilus assembly protein PilV [Methylibium sp.]|nr:pilus assembly protein PilV [Methylibium sp.]
MQARKTSRPRPIHAQAGVVLIEALVAMLIFVIGVLGVVGLQASMTRAQTSANFRGDASYLATQLVGTMWGDIPNLGNYGTGQCDAYARCSDWKLKVAEVLPGGSVDVVVATGLVTVTITWTVPNEGQHSYATSTAIRS